MSDRDEHNDEPGVLPSESDDAFAAAVSPELALVAARHTSPALPLPALRALSPRAPSPRSIGAPAAMHAMLLATGANEFGQLGVGSGDELVPSFEMVKYDDQSDALVQLASGARHAVAVSETGHCYTWGDNEEGQLGRPGRASVPARVEALDTHAVAFASAGASHTVAVTLDGLVFGWGSGSSGQIGERSDEPRRVPRRVPVDAPIARVACGNLFTLLLARTGDVYALGSGPGKGISAALLSTPTLIPALSSHPIIQVACGGEHTLFLSALGNVFACGANNLGQLGLGDVHDRVDPTLVEAFQSHAVRKVSAGGQHSAVLEANGTVFTFGSNSHGQLGHGAADASPNSYPRAVSDLLGSNIVDLSLGRRHSVAIEARPRDQGVRVWTWGINSSGQLGTADFRSRHGPTSINLSCDCNYVNARVSTGNDHTFVWFCKDVPIAPPIHALTVREANELLATDVLALTRRISLAFASPSALNASFNQAPDQFILSPTSSGFDLKGLAQLWTRILNTGNPDLLRALTTGVSRVVTAMVKQPAAGVDPEVVRLLLFLPMNPMMATSAMFAPGQSLVRLIAGLPRQALVVLGTWCSRLAAFEFRMIVRTVQFVLSNTLRTAPSDRRTQLDCCLVLQMLSQVNRRHAILPLKLFYVPEIVDLVDLVSDYTLWVTTKDAFCFCRFPFLLDPAAKSRVLLIESQIQQQRRVQAEVVSALMTGRGNPYNVLTVRRSHLLSDTIRQITALTAADVKKPLRVVFEDEEAVDEGGVRKEFFQLLMRELFKPDFGLFVQNDDTRLLWFNRNSIDTGESYYLIGILLGLAIYNGVILSLTFPAAVYKKIAHEPLSLEDLDGVDPVVCRSLTQLLAYEGEDVEDVFCLSFEVEEDFFGEIRRIALKENGASTAVTSQNKEEYVRLYVEYLLQKSVQNQFNEFERGFRLVMNGPTMSMFRAEEWELFLCGAPDFDLHDLEPGTEYHNGYTKDHPTIRLFWKVAHSFTPEQQRQLLFFATGSDRVPIGGLSKMVFRIQRSGDDQSRLPAAHTCFNLLDLPEYTDEETMRKKLEVAIQNTEGFGLL